MTAVAAGLSPDWLALREPADAAARAADLVVALRRDLPLDRPLVVHDLGCGTGSMGRWLAPQLPGPQHWVLHDREAALLAHAARRTPAAAADGTPVTVETRPHDLDQLQPGELDGASLLTASALLDMLTHSEVERLVEVCTGAGCPVLLSLSVVGRVELSPADPLDAAVTAAFNAHQRRTAGGRRLLGPDAVGVAAALFARLGAEVVVQPSPWRLGAGDADLLLAWFTGWLAAAREQRPELATADPGLCPAASGSGSQRPAAGDRAPPGPAGATAAPVRCVNESGRRHVCLDEEPRVSSRASGPGERRGGRGGAMSRALWPWLRLLAGGGFLAVLVARLGAGPFLDGLSALSAGPLAAAAGLTLVTTVCSAWRWRVVARGLGVGLPLAEATGAYYRSQFLNTVLPGGVLGDVHRAVSHGHEVGDVGRGLRAVGWERSAGQVLQVLVALVVLLALPSPVRRFVPAAVGAVLAVGLVVALAARALRRRGRVPGGRVLRAAGADVRAGLLARRAWPGVLVASLVVIAGHTATFVLAARTAGVEAPLARLLPLVMLVMLAMAVPANIGGWGPREGAAAGLFALAGLGAAAGVAAATVYGVMVLVGTLPGAVVLVVAGTRRGRRPGHGPEPAFPALVPAPPPAVARPRLERVASEGVPCA